MSDIDKAPPEGIFLDKPISTMALADNLYQKLTNEEDARLCRDIDEQTCRTTPRNFYYLLTSYFLTKLGDAIASPKTTLAWLTSAVGAAAFVLGLLVPIRESGSLIPQLFIGGIICQLPVRERVWVAESPRRPDDRIGRVRYTLKGRTPVETAGESGHSAQIPIWPHPEIAVTRSACSPNST